MVAALAPEWSESDDDYLAELLDAQYGGEGFRDYICRVSPRHIPPKHLDPLLELWERTRHEPVFACVQMPPRHIKTTTGLHGLAWRMQRDPVLRHGFATFGDDFAATRSRICRTIYRAGGGIIPKDQSAMHMWSTSYGGGLNARGYQGEWTGKGIDGVFLLDDLYKDRASAESKKIRENVWEWFTDVAWTRREPGMSMICQFTRWHDDDLIGRLLQGKFQGYRFELINLPAICEEVGPDGFDIIGRVLGDALWPTQYPVEELRKIEESIGPYSWASLYQQRPRPKGADVFFPEQFGRFSLLRWRPDGHRILICADPAASEDTRADFSALFVLAAKGYGSEMVIDVLYGWRGHVSIPAFARKLLETSRLFYNAPVVVEAVAGFKAVPQTLKEIEPRLAVRAARMGDPSVDQKDDAARVSNIAVNKFLRSQPCAAAANSGRVRFPVDAEAVWNPRTSRFEMPTVITRLRAGVAPGITWADEAMYECGKFTGVDDPEDDQVDALSHGFNELHSSRNARRGQGQNRNPFG